MPLLGTAATIVGQAPRACGGDAIIRLTSDNVDLRTRAQETPPQVVLSTICHEFNRRLFSENFFGATRCT